MASVLLCEINASVVATVRTFDKQDGTKATINDVRLYKFEMIAAQQTQQAAAATASQLWSSSRRAIPATGRCTR